MGMQFHETVRGVKFFDRDIPALIKALNRVADELEKNRELEERKLVLKESEKKD